MEPGGLILVVLFVGGFLAMVARTIQMATRDPERELDEATQHGVAPVAVRNYPNHPNGLKRMATEIELMHARGHVVENRTPTAKGVAVLYSRR